MWLDFERNVKTKVGKSDGSSRPSNKGWKRPLVSIDLGNWEDPPKIKVAAITVGLNPLDKETYYVKTRELCVGSEDGEIATLSPPQERETWSTKDEVKILKSSISQFDPIELDAYPVVWGVLTAPDNVDKFESTNIFEIEDMDTSLFYKSDNEGPKESVTAGMLLNKHCRITVYDGKNIIGRHYFKYSYYPSR